jgi:hypothetical protein
VEHLVMEVAKRVEGLEPTSRGDDVVVQLTRPRGGP